MSDLALQVVEGSAGYFTDPRETRWLRAVSSGPSILVMEAPEHWERDDVPLGRAERVNADETAGA